jgi:phage terminase large subunit GpA-like protein
MEYTYIHGNESMPIRGRTVVFLNEERTEAALYTEKKTKCLIEKMDTIEIEGQKVFVGDHKWYRSDPNWVDKTYSQTLFVYASINDAKRDIIRMKKYAEAHSSD